MAPYEQSLFAVKPLIRISIYERMLTESFARFNFNRLETCASLIISEFRSHKGSACGYAHIIPHEELIIIRF